MLVANCHENMPCLSYNYRKELGTGPAKNTSGAMECLAELWNVL